MKKNSLLFIGAFFALMILHCNVIAQITFSQFSDNDGPTFPSYAYTNTGWPGGGGIELRLYNFNYTITNATGNLANLNGTQMLGFCVTPLWADPYNNYQPDYFTVNDPSYLRYFPGGSGTTDYWSINRTLKFNAIRDILATYQNQLLTSDKSSQQYADLVTAIGMMSSEIVMDYDGTTASLDVTKGNSIVEFDPGVPLGSSSNPLTLFNVIKNTVVGTGVGANFTVYVSSDVDSYPQDLISFPVPPACSTPTATASAIQPSCTGTNAPNNGQIKINNFSTNQRYQYSSGGSGFNPTTALPTTITAIPTSGVISSTLPNTSGDYWVRIYDATDNNCYVDSKVSIVAVTCTSCTTPTVAAVTFSTPSCTNEVANNNGSVTVTGIANGFKVGIVPGATYANGPSFADATVLSGTSITIGSLPNSYTSQTYTVRVFGTDATCFVDKTVTIPASVCTLPTCTSGGVDKISDVATMIDCGDGNIPLALYLKSAGSSFFSIAPGTSPKFIEYANGTALVDLYVVDNADALLGWHFSAVFTGKSTTTTKPIVPPGACTGKTATAQPDWYYYTGVSSVKIIGIGGFTGAEIRYDGTDHDVEVGTAAQTYDPSFGLGFWINITKIKSPFNTANDFTVYVGDLLVNLKTGVACCVTPTALVAATQPTCTGTNAPNNGRLTINGFTAGQRYQYSVGGTGFNATGAQPATITAIPTGGVLASTLPNTTSDYWVRIYDATDNTCFVDRKVTITAVSCCAKPVASVSPKTQTICLGTTPSAFTVSPSTGVAYRWFGPLADTTTAAFGTSIATTASYTPSGTVLTAAGVHYYAVIVNTTGDIACADTAFVKFTVNAKPNAGADAAAICAPATTAKLTAITAGGTWSPIGSPANPANAAISSTGTITGMTANGTYRFVYAVTSNGKTCTDTAQVVRYPAPLVGLSDYDICEGEIITFGFEPQAGLSYVWNTGATTSTITVAPTTTTSYRVTVTNQNTGCSAKDTAVVTVNPKPLAGKDTLSCLSTLQLKPAPSGSTWAFLSFNNPNNPSQTGTATINNQGQVTGMNLAGFYRFVLTNLTTSCQDTIRVQRRIVSAPQIVLDPACAGSTVTFGYTNSTDFTYLWNTGATTAEISVSPSTTTEYIATITEIATGCSVKDTTTLTIKPKPVITLVNSVCSADLKKYTINVTVTSGAVLTANAGVVSGSGTSYSITVGVDTTSFTISAILNGCKANLVVNKPNCNCPTINPPVGTNKSYCAGTPIPTLTVTVDAGLVANWYASATSTTLLATGLSYTPIAAGTYYVEASNTLNGCKSLTRTALTLSVVAKPAAGKDTTLVCNNGNVPNSVQLKGTPTGGSWTGLSVNPTGATVNSSGLVTVNNASAQGKSYQFVYTLNGCTDTLKMIVPPCSQPCVKSSVVSTQPICSTDAQTYTFSFTVSNKLGTIKVNKGSLSGTNPYTVSGVPSGQNVIITDSLSATCKLDTTITGVNCNCNPSLPKLTTASFTVCKGDTFPTLRATVVGLATVEWFSQATGGTVLFTGLNYKPSGTVTGTTTYYAQARSTDPTCPAAISTSRVPATINVQDCTKEVDLALSKSISKKIAQIGDVLTYTLKVWNESSTNATGVSVTDSIATTVQLVSGSFVASRGNVTSSGHVIKWNIGNMAANGDTVTLTYQIKVTQEGVHFNTAEICTTNEKDVDSTPCNHDEEEDDIDRECFTVPVKLCTGEVVEVSIPARYTNVQWFKNGGTTPIASGNTVLFSNLGSYTFTATNQTCPAEGCCPVIIEAGTNCCPVDLCIPFTIKQKKKASTKL